MGKREGGTLLTISTSSFPVVGKGLSFNAMRASSDSGTTEFDSRGRKKSSSEPVGSNNRSSSARRDDSKIASLKEKLRALNKHWATGLTKVLHTTHNSLHLSTLTEMNVDM